MNKLREGYYKLDEICKAIKFMETELVLKQLEENKKELIKMNGVRKIEKLVDMKEDENDCY